MSQMPDDFLEYLIDRKGKSIYVVMDKKGRTVLKDPGLNQPYTNANKKVAEHIAQQCGGVCVLLGDAIAILNKNSKPND